MSLDSTKTNKNIGEEIHQHLIEQGVETPMVEVTPDWMDKDAIETKFKDIMQILGLDLKDDSLKDSPKRVAKMFTNEIFWGLNYENFPKVTVVENKMHYDEMVLEKNIAIKSHCEHHFVAILGKAHIAYIPNQKVLGLSKLNRIAEFFARRPQIQERLTEQIYYALSFILETKDVAVVIEADHMCVKMRGVEDSGSSTVTSKLGGKFMDVPALRQEFMGLIR